MQHARHRSCSHVWGACCLASLTWGSTLVRSSHPLLLRLLRVLGHVHVQHWGEALHFLWHRRGWRWGKTVTGSRYSRAFSQIFLLGCSAATWIPISPRSPLLHTQLSALTTSLANLCLQAPNQKQRAQLCLAFLTSSHDCIQPSLFIKLCSVWLVKVLLL